MQIPHVFRADPRFSRRSFLAGSAGSIAALSTVGVAAAQSASTEGDEGGSGTAEAAKLPNAATGRPMPKLLREPPLPPEERVGFAIVGLGKFGLNQIAPSFAESRMCRLTALVSGSREKAERVAAEYGVEDASIYSYEDFDRIAENDAVDVVYIILPNSLHAEFAIRAFKVGKHVLCEKPIATSVEDAERMIQAAATADRKLMVAYRAQYEPHSLTAMKMIRDGEIGRVRVVTTDNGRELDPEDVADQWRMNRALSGGGALPDVGIYGVNGTRYLLNEEPVEISASMDKRPDDPRFKDVDDVVTWMMKFPSGAIAHGSTSYSYKSASRFHVMGEEGTLTMDPATDYYEHALEHQTAAGTEDIQVQAENQFAAEMDHMASAVKDGTPIKTPGEEGLQDMRIIAAIYEAAESGRTVKVDWSYTRAVPPEQGAPEPGGGE